jgi:hypothetical protein
MDCHLYTLPGATENLYLLSPLDQKTLAGLNSRSEFFLGRLIDPNLGAEPENINYNADFLVILHEIVRDLMVNDPEVLTQAQEQPNGFVFIVDQRVPANEEVAKEDIIGIFLVQDKQTDVARYRPNPDYRLISKKGVGMFPEKVEKRLLEKLMG